MTEPIEVKLERIGSELDRRSLDELWLLRPENFAWLTGGNTVVDAAADTGVVAIGTDGESLTLVAPNNEVSRILAEELPDVDDAGLDIHTVEFEWYEADVPEMIRSARDGTLGADVHLDGFEHVDPAPLRTPLPEAELDEFRTAAVETTEAVEATARALDPETTEREAAARMSDELIQRGFAVPVLLVGGSDRGTNRRHFTPKDDPLDGLAHLTVVSVRDGYNVAVTRTVTFDPPEWLAERHDAASRVAATANVATYEEARNGGTAEDVFAAVQDAYAEVGYPDEWRLHHQGGAIGYESREWTSGPDVTEDLVSPQPYAWNPTVQGAKSEDTIVVADDLEVVTETGDWPTTEYEAVGYDRSLELHDAAPADEL
jgi:Xaa-Pro aminopeptidase